MKKNKGITLIALIITIIIMLILVAVSVSIIINSGLISKTKEAASKTKTAYESEQELSNGKITIGDRTYNSIDEFTQSLCSSHVYGEWTTTREPTCSVHGERQQVCLNCGYANKEAIERTAHTYDTTTGRCTVCGELVIGARILNYNPNVPEDGQTISFTSYTVPTGTLNADGTVTEGSGYSTDVQAYTLASITEWRVLGTDNGQIVIVAANPIKTDLNKNLYITGQVGYVSYVNELNRISALYGQGKYADKNKFSVSVGGNTIATGARSMTRNDLVLCGYTIEVKPAITATFKTNDEGYVLKSDGTVSEYQNFTYWAEYANGDKKENKWKTLGNNDSVTITSPESTSVSKTDLDSNSLLYKMVRKNANDSFVGYWLATRKMSFNSDGGFANFHIIYLNTNGNVNAVVPYISYDYPNQGSMSVRPVVYLKSDVQLSFSGTSDGNGGFTSATYTIQ